MRLYQACGWVLPIAMVLPIGCKDNSAAEGAAHTASAAATATAAVTAAATATASARPERPRRQGRRGSGLAGMLLGAAHELDLKEAQKATLDKLGEDLRGAGPVKEIKDLHTSLIAAASSKLCTNPTCWSAELSSTKLAPSYDAIDKAVAARHDKEAEALNGLHAALEPAQRKALVASVRSKQAEREAHAAEREKKHGDDEKKHGDDEKKHGDGEKKHGDGEKKAGDGEWSKRGLDRLTKELDLDAAQQKSVGALLDKEDHPTAAAAKTLREEAKKRQDALLTAFEGDTFDARKLELAGPGKKLREQLEHHVQELAQLLPLLKPEQREKLVAGMEKHSAVRGEQGATHDDEHAYHPLFDEQPMGREQGEPREPRP